MAALLQAVQDLMQAEYKKPAPLWRNIYTLPLANQRFLEQECSKPSEFDPLGHRRALFQQYRAGKTPFEARECEWGRVIVLYANEKQAVPWEIWGRILRCYASRRSAATKKGQSVENRSKACVYLLASTFNREFPVRGPITPAHINGGYTYHGNNQTIMIYRAEDATRVLIHELQHAAGLDCLEAGVDLVEAETEAWAELLYCGFLSRGDAALFRAMVDVQAHWMQEQNRRVARYLARWSTQGQSERSRSERARGQSERSRSDQERAYPFPWRYTVGKEEVWRRWGLVGPRVVAAHSPRGMYSLRLGAPPQAAVKGLHGVEVENVML
jgi:hypothetical protein